MDSQHAEETEDFRVIGEFIGVVDRISIKFFLDNLEVSTKISTFALKELILWVQRTN